MKIAIVGPFFLPQFFGVEKVMWNHARYLAQRGHEVHVITSAQRFPEGTFKDVPKEQKLDGFAVHRVGVILRSPSRVFYYLSNSGLLLDKLSQKLEALSPDVVHVHNVASPAWAYVSARHTRRYGKKLFYSLHYHPDCLGMSRWHTSLMHGLNRLPLLTSRRLFHLTKLDFSWFAQEYPYVDRERFAVLPNGVDPPCLDTPPRVENDALNLLFVGRVEDPRKGFDLLEKAYAKVRQPTWILTVVGLISDAKRSSLQKRFGSAIRVLGVVEEAVLEREYAATDLFVMPSRYEGFGMPYIEAMRYGVPVIGTRVGGIPEVVPPETGILISPDDEPALSEAMRDLGTSRDRRTALGNSGKCWSDRFHWDRIVDLLETHYAKD